jgi:hypothetical protein
MSGYEWDDDDDFEGASGDSGAIKELRKAYKAAQRQNKELMEQLDSLKSSVRDRSVQDVIASRGLPSKVAKLIPKDAASAEEVEAWLDEYGEVFGIKPDSSEEQQPAAPNPDLQAMSRISAAQSSGQPYSGDADQLDALIRGAQTPEELNKILFGNLTGPQAV